MHDNKVTVVTGGCGFIGVNLQKRLAGHRTIRVVDHLQRSSPTGWSDDGESSLYAADILDGEALAAALEGADEVVHLAAYGSVVESVENPVPNFTVNVEGTLNVLRAAVSAGVRRVIFASTGGALIGDAAPPVDENSLPKPISPYGASKLCGEAYCNAFAKSYGLETVCLRFGNVYGPHSAHKKGAVTTFIKALMQDKPIVIYGDGKASRDYIHVEDLCNGIVAALETAVEGAEVFHLAAGQETTVFELADMLRKIAGKPDHPIEFRSARRGEVERNFASYEKARKLLGFKAEFGVEEGLAATWVWFQSQEKNVVHVDTTDS